MASVTYDEIFSLFLGSITDYKLASLEENDAANLMKEYLHKALSASYVRRLFSSIAFDDDNNILNYEINFPTNPSEDADFIKNAIAKWMVYEWVHNIVRNIINTSQFFGGSEQKYYSQSNHLSELRALMDDTYKEARAFILDRGWIHNSYLGG